MEVNERTLAHAYINTLAGAFASHGKILEWIDVQAGATNPDDVIDANGCMVQAYRRLTGKELLLIDDWVEIDAELKARYDAEQAMVDGAFALARSAHYDTRRIPLEGPVRAFHKPTAAERAEVQRQAAADVQAERVTEAYQMANLLRGVIQQAHSGADPLLHLLLLPLIGAATDIENRLSQIQTALEVRS